MLITQDKLFIIIVIDKTRSIHQVLSCSSNTRPTTIPIQTAQAINNFMNIFIGISPSGTRIINAFNSQNQRCPLGRIGFHNELRFLSEFAAGL